MVFQETDDGFKLSEHDLRLRGPGDFIGVRQSGMPELKIADLNDLGLIETARDLAERYGKPIPTCARPNTLHCANACTCSGRISWPIDYRFTGPRAK